MPNIDKYIRNIILSVAVVSSVILFLGLIGGVDPGSIYSILPYILLGAIFFLAQYLMKTLKFYLLCRFYNSGVSFMDALHIRVASELFSLVGFSYLGDEAFRIYILNKKYGVKLHRSGIIGYMEVFSEVIVSLGIVLIGIFLLLIRGLALVIIIPIAISAAIISLVNFLIVFRPGMIGGFLKGVIFRFRRFIGRERVESIITSLDGFIDAFNEDMGSLLSNWLFALLVILTVVSAVFGGLSLWILSVGMGYEIGVLYSIIILNFSVVLSTLPITISGSGIFEIVILLLGGSLINGLPWLLPISYRISSYYIPLLVTLIFFLTGVRKYLS